LQSGAVRDALMSGHSPSQDGLMAGS